MTDSSTPLLRQAAAWAHRTLRIVSLRFAVIVAILVAVASSAHAAAPFEVRVTGTGPEVLLIPGLASSGAVWDETVKSLCGAHRCHVFTLAGFAGVPARSGALLDDVDAALAAYIEAQHLKAPTVVGHSLGGFVAQDPAAYAAGQARQIATLVTAPDDVARVQAWGRDSDRRAVIAATSDMLGEDLRPRLAAIKAPTLVMGSWIAYKDQSTMEQTRAVYERQYRTLAGVQITMSPAGRHFIMLDDPAWFEKTLESFVP